MKKIILSVLLCGIVAFSIQAQPNTPTQRRASTPLKYGAHRVGKRTDADMQRWREHGLGQFIHWGVYAIPGGTWDGETNRGAAEWIRSWSEKNTDGKNSPKMFKGIPFTQIYDEFYKQFNPTGFDAAQWAKQAKDMGVKYMIFTTKHHDGFCMWPSKYTNYTIANTPYKKDIVKQIVDAYTKEGIDVHLYFSIIDWNHKGYRSSVPQTDTEKASYEEFKQFTRNQLIELLDNYPQAKGLWFDGSWDQAWIKEAAWVDELGNELRAKHPGLVIGSRFRADDYGKRHYDSNGDLIDDYDQTWERDIPNSINDLNRNDWDCVMTVPENQWGYHSDWSLTYVKTPYNLLEMMVRCISMDGNFVVNFGPDGKGIIRAEEAHIAKEMGEWMKVNSEAIYGAGHIDLKQQGWGYYTKKDNKVYLNVFNRPINNMLRVEIPRGGIKPLKAYFLADKKEISINNAGRDKRNSSLFDIAIPESYISKNPFVIVLDIEENKSDTDSYQQAKI